MTDPAVAFKLSAPKYSSNDNDNDNGNDAHHDHDHRPQPQPPAPKRFKSSEEEEAPFPDDSKLPDDRSTCSAINGEDNRNRNKKPARTTSLLAMTATTAPSSRSSSSSSSSSGGGGGNSSNSDSDSEVESETKKDKGSQKETKLKNDDDDDHDDASSSSSDDSKASSASSASSGPHLPRAAARGAPLHRMDAQQLNLEHDDEDGDEDGDDMDEEEEATMVRRIIAEAMARGIPLPYLQGLISGGPGDDNHDDDEPIEYPFESPPQSLQDVAQFIQSPQCRKILVLAGAGMSVASGIPDFRSPNGLYATLQVDRLSADEIQKDRIRADPSYSLDQHLFLENPLPCLEVNREFVLGIQERKWKATLAHRFVQLLNKKTNKLCRLYTQNIDGLEDQCGSMLPHSKRIAVHGSMDEAECALCQYPMPLDEFCRLIQTQIKDITGQDPTAPAQSTPIHCKRCRAPAVKPNIVLFRSSLPRIFFEKVPEDTSDVDLLIIMGTSLGVAPANSIVRRVPKSCMRVLINREPVGWHLGLDYSESVRDFWAGRGNCENVVLDLMTHLGWLEDLRPFLEKNELPETSLELLKHALFQSTEQKNGHDKSEDGDGKVTTTSSGSATATITSTSSSTSATDVKKTTSSATEESYKATTTSSMT